MLHIYESISHSIDCVPTVFRALYLPKLSTAWGFSPWEPLLSTISLLLVSQVILYHSFLLTQHVSLVLLSSQFIVQIKFSPEQFLRVLSESTHCLHIQALLYLWNFWSYFVSHAHLLLFNIFQNQSHWYLLTYSTNVNVLIGIVHK